MAKPLDFLRTLKEAIVRSSTPKYYKVQVRILSLEENKKYFNEILKSINSDSMLPRVKDEDDTEKDKNIALIPHTTPGEEIYVYIDGENFVEVCTGKKVTYKYKSGASNKVHLGETGALFIDTNDKRIPATEEEVSRYKIAKTGAVKGILFGQQKKAENNYQEIIGYILLKQTHQQALRGHGIK